MSEKEVTVRAARKSDLAAVQNIYKEVCEVFAKGENLQGWDNALYPTDETARSALERGDLFVALTPHGETAGTMVFNSRQSPEYADVRWNVEAEPEKVRCIHTFCVSPRFRGTGAAKAMIAHAKKLAAEQGVRTIRLDTSSKNAASNALYSGAGFEKCGRIDLGNESRFGIKWYWCYDFAL